MDFFITNHYKNDKEDLELTDKELYEILNAAINSPDFG